MQKQKKKYRKTIVLSALTAMLFCCSLAVSANADKPADTDKNYDILFISSYSYSWPTVPLQIEGIQSAIDDTVNLDIEFTVF